MTMGLIPIARLVLEGGTVTDDQSKMLQEAATLAEQDRQNVKEYMAFMRKHKDILQPPHPST